MRPDAGRDMQQAMITDDKPLARTRWLATVLTYLGTLPFIGAALLLASAGPNVPYLGAPEAVVRAYGLVIVSFMAGAHWGHQIVLGARVPMNLYATSIVVALCAWLSYLLLNDAAFMIVLIGLFASLLAIDFRLYQSGVIDRHYVQTRSAVTAIVISALAIIALGG